MNLYLMYLLLRGSCCGCYFSHLSCLYYYTTVRLIIKALLTTTLGVVSLLQETEPLLLWKFLFPINTTCYMHNYDMTNRCPIYKYTCYIFVRIYTTEHFISFVLCSHKLLFNEICVILEVFTKHTKLFYVPVQEIETGNKM